MEMMSDLSVIHLHDCTSGYRSVSTRPMSFLLRVDRNGTWETSQDEAIHLARLAVHITSVLVLERHTGGISSDSNGDLMIHENVEHHAE